MKKSFTLLTFFLLFILFLIPTDRSIAQTQKGQDIDGEAANDRSGTSVSLSSDGTMVAIGAPGNDGSGNDAGHVRVYSFNSGTMMWEQKGQDIDDEAANDQ